MLIFKDLQYKGLCDAGGRCDNPSDFVSLLSIARYDGDGWNRDQV